MNAILWQKLEGAAVFVSALVAYWLTSNEELAWWAAVLWFFAPDLSLAAYLAGARVGALGYNAVHVYGFGVAVIAGGLIFGCPLAVALGWLWLGHSGFDRMLGYGLKLPSGFQDTHLGRIGKGR
jgi:hypothetical protein